MTTKVYCSLCDADVGVGRKQGLCYDMCESWFDTCHSDYFVVDYLNNNKLTFASTQPTLKGRQLTELVSDAEEFCL